jgi:putative membrane protein
MMYGIRHLGYGAHAAWMAWAGPIGMLIFWLLVAAVMVTLIVYLVRLARKGGRPGSAMAILEERYARGEISKEEFAEKKAVLGA